MVRAGVPGGVPRQGWSGQVHADPAGEHGQLTAGGTAAGIIEHPADRGAQTAGLFRVRSGAT